MLVLSYAAPRNVALLAEYFGDAADLVVHYDRKLGPAGDLPRPPRVHVIPSRAVFWGGWSMVESMIDLLRAARAHTDADRFALISDDSAPLLPIQALHDRLAEPVDRIWSDANVPAQIAARYRNFHYFDHVATSARHVDPRERIVDDELVATIAQAAELRRRGKRPVALRHGPQWWSLTRKTVDQVLAQHDADAWLRQSFQFSAIPDEMYVHTLSGRDAHEAFMFVDWNQPEKPTTFRTMDEIRRADPRGSLFVRKVDATSPPIAELMRTGRFAN